MKEVKQSFQQEKENYKAVFFQKRTVCNRQSVYISGEIQKRIMQIVGVITGKQISIGNFIDNEKGKNGCIYEKRSGFCMETQYYPDACNQNSFESSVLKAGDKYDTTTVYKFSVKN